VPPSRATKNLNSFQLFAETATNEREEAEIRGLLDQVLAQRLVLPGFERTPRAPANLRHASPNGGCGGDSQS